MRKMRHKNWKTYLKIACSWLLIFSICFMNLETVSASEDETSVVTEQEETQDTEAFTSETDAQLLWSSIFVTLMANKIGGLQFGIYRNCQISSRVFHTAVAALPLTKANRSDFE